MNGNFARKSYRSTLSILMLSGLTTASGACLNHGAFDLAPDYKEEKFVLPDTWQGVSPFVQANPSDAALRHDWWKVFNDPQLDLLEDQAMEGNPDLQAAAERFIQARDQMMKARSRYIPKLGVGAEASDNKQSAEALFRSGASPLYDTDSSFGAFASWEPDFWSRLRNATRAEIYRAEERAADFALVRLGLQAELASAYFTLRGIDAQNAIYSQSIEYYTKSLDIVKVMLKGDIVGQLDVARAEYLLTSTQARQLGLQAKRQVVEHAIAILVNRVPTTFSIKAADTINVNAFQLPRAVPSTLLERRPDVAAMERKMAQANRMIGVARGSFFPNIPIGGKIGEQSRFSPLLGVNTLFWAVGAALDWGAFEGGFRRAELQQAWSIFRETQDLYRSTVLNAFREVEDGFSLTSLQTVAVQRQAEAAAAAGKQQDLSMELFKGSLASSLDLINSQLNALDSRITLAEMNAELARSAVGLVRSLGGGWDRAQLPKDDDVQPFNLFQYTGLSKPDAAGNIDVQVENRDVFNNLTKPMPQ